MRLLAAVVPLVALIVLLATTLSPERPRLAGGNSVPAKVAVIGLNHAGDQGCQVDETIPGGATSLTLGISSSGAAGPALDVRVTSSGRMVAHGRLAAGYADSGTATIPITAVTRTAPATTVCVKNLGPGPINLWGNAIKFGTPLTAAGTKQMAKLTLIWNAKPDSYLDRLPAIVHHADTGGTQVFGGFTLWVPLALVMLAAAAALVVTLRETGA